METSVLFSFATWSSGRWRCFAPTRPFPPLQRHMRHPALVDLCSRFTPTQHCSVARNHRNRGSGTLGPNCTKLRGQLHEEVTVQEWAVVSRAVP
ncbi:unnamed protein product [Mesocestoides corti]|uniref:Secreted protein n=1 Tax=Mesocestoides corti TaxID=53468 RepID=A0A0R3UDN0_MESCO|nr:unnamed protein product [Mesocestoides corti]